MTIRFDGQVIIVTGAGGGLGRAHALEFAKRGGKVVVNDLGGARDGTGGSVSAAQAVVEEIEAAGGEALADGANVPNYEQVEAMVAAAMDSMMTSSSSGVYGNFGQSNYGAAKLGLAGRMNTLHLEGMKYNIHVNTLAPVAATRMTEDLMADDVLAALEPALVTPAVIFMCSEQAPSRQIIAAGAGGFARAAIVETQGILLDGDEVTAENVAAGWEEASDLSTARELMQGSEQSVKFLTALAKRRGITLER